MNRSAFPDTAMSKAFLIALAHWVAAHHEDDSATVMLPTGTVGAEDLVRVLHALEKARAGLTEHDGFHA